MLLVNRCRGFPVQGSSGPHAAAPGSSKRPRQRAKVPAASGSEAASGRGGRQQAQLRVSLEPEIVQSILRFATADMGAWVAVLQTTHPWAERPPRWY